MIKGAIFDADGTLLDSTSIYRNLAQSYLLSKGRTPDRDLSSRLSNKSMGEVLALLKDEYDLEESLEQMQSEIHALIHEDYYEKVALKPGVYSFIKLLRENKVRLCVATSTDAVLIKGALRRLEIWKDFDFIITSRDVEVGKSSPLIYEKALEILKLNKEDVLVFEDAYYAARTAENAGFRVIGVYESSEPKQKKLRRKCHGYTKDYSNYDNWDVPDFHLQPKTPLYDSYSYINTRDPARPKARVYHISDLGDQAKPVPVMQVRHFNYKKLKQ